MLLAAPAVSSTSEGGRPSRRPRPVEHITPRRSPRRLSPGHPFATPSPRGVDSFLSFSANPVARPPRTGEYHGWNGVSSPFPSPKPQAPGSPESGRAHTPTCKTGRNRVTPLVLSHWEKVASCPWSTNSGTFGSKPCHRRKRRNGGLFCRAALTIHNPACPKALARGQRPVLAGRWHRLAGTVPPRARSKSSSAPRRQGPSGISRAVPEHHQDEPSRGTPVHSSARSALRTQKARQSVALRGAGPLPRGPPQGDSPRQTATFQALWPTLLRRWSVRPAGDGTGRPDALYTDCPTWRNAAGKPTPVSRPCWWRPFAFFFSARRSNERELAHACCSTACGNCLAAAQERGLRVGEAPALATLGKQFQSCLRNSVVLIEAVGGRNPGELPSPPSPVLDLCRLSFKRPRQSAPGQRGEGSAFAPAV